MQRWQCQIHQGTLQTLIYLEDIVVFHSLKVFLFYNSYILFPTEQNAEVIFGEKTKQKIISLKYYKNGYLIHT